MTKRRPPSDLSGRGGRCGVQILAAPSRSRNSARPSRNKPVERLLARRAAERAYAAFGNRSSDPLSSAFFAILDHAAFGFVGLLVDPQRLRQIGIELARRHRAFADIGLLRRLGETARRRARLMGIGEIGAAVPGIVRRAALVRSASLALRVPWPMAGLSRSASASSSAGASGRAALARVGLAGSFFECLAGSRCFGAIGPIWGESGGE